MLDGWCESLHSVAIPDYLSVDNLYVVMWAHRSEGREVQMHDTGVCLASLVFFVLL